MKRRVSILIGTAMLVTFSTYASDSLIDLDTSGQQFIFDKAPVDGTPGLWDRFNSNFPLRAQTKFSDTFHPFNMIKDDGEGQMRLFNESFDDSVEMANDALFDSVSSSLRGAALAMDYPVMNWIRDQEDFLASLLWDSLDSDDELSVSPLDLSYHQAERSWWSRVAKSSRLRFGLRPINTSPYAFVSWHIKSKERVWLLGHLRYRLRGFTDHSFELGLSVPFGNRLSLDFGTCYRIGRVDDAKSLVCKITKYVGENAVVFAGVEAQTNPIFVAGVSTAW